MPCKNKGFTLVELMVVVLILGALAFVAIPRIAESSTTAKINACRTNIDILNQQAEFIKVNTGEYPDHKKPKDWDDIELYFPDGVPECPFGVDYEYDKDLNRMKPHSH